MSLNRRRFLQNLSLTASAAALARADLVLADNQPQSRSAGDKLGYAVVGVNGQGNAHLGVLTDRDDVEILYICDVDERVGRQRAEQVGQKQGRTPQYVRDFRRALEDDAVDCVSTATPNHWHALVTIWSLQAGKDVYVEKPVSHNVWEGRQMVNWARRLDRICQCGTQSRSSQSLHEAVDFVQNGQLGPIQYVVGTCYKPRQSIGLLEQPLQIPESIDYDLWCGPAAKVDLYRPRLHYDWHWDFNTGNGDMGNQGIHQMDIARWFLGVETVSPRVMSIGGRLGYVDAGNTPNTQVVFHDYPDAPLIFETRGLPRRDLDWKQGMPEYRGSRIGVIVQCEQGYVLVPNYYAATAFDNDGNEVKSWNSPGDTLARHHGNFIESVRSRNHEDLNADILKGHLSSALCHTGGVSHRVGARAVADEIAAKISGNELCSDSYSRMADHLEANGIDVSEAVLTLGPWLDMDVETETFIGNDDANALLRREYRDGFVVPEASA